MENHLAARSGYIIKLDNTLTPGSECFLPSVDYLPDVITKDKRKIFWIVTLSKWLKILLTMPMWRFWGADAKCIL